MQAEREREPIAPQIRTYHLPPSKYFLLELPAIAVFNAASQFFPDGAGLDETVVELVQAVAARGAKGEQAFVELIRRFEPAALAVALAICGRGGDAGDLAQEAFMRAWKNISQLKQPERFAAWLLEIVRHLALDRARQARRFQGAPSLDLPDPRSADPAKSLGRQESHHMLREALSELDEVTRQIVMLRYYQTRSSCEIGAMLNLTPAAVDMRLSRARQLLRHKLQPKDISTHSP